jgi:hypothetical protein
MKLTVESFLAVKEVSDQFVLDRDWSKFHQPKNLALALAGEVITFIVVTIYVIRSHM